MLGLSGLRGFDGMALVIRLPKYNFCGETAFMFV